MLPNRRIGMIKNQKGTNNAAFTKYNYQTFTRILFN